MKQLATLAAKLLGAFDYDIAINEEHHRMKKDAPSGTAKALGDAVIAGNERRKAADLCKRSAPGISSASMK